MTSAPPITIGLPVYNGENYLGEALDSLLSQTFSDFRLVVSDNASTDLTEEIAREAAKTDPRIEYFRQPTNMGAAANYNFTVDQATGDYFVWHAHDDLRAPQFLEKAYAAFQLNPDVSVVFSRTMAVDAEASPMHLLERPDALLSSSPHLRLRGAITAPNPDVVVFGLMKRRLLNRTGRHGTFRGGDRVLAAELSLLGQFVELSETLFFNRDHPTRYVRMRDSGHSQSSIDAWWDPAHQTGAKLPRWRGLLGYLRAIRRYELTSRERTLCYAALLQSLFDNRMYIPKQLARDLLQAGMLVLGGDRSSPASKLKRKGHTRDHL